MFEQKNFFACNIDIPRKTFIRETCNIPTTSGEKDKHRLNFQGSEARKAYEEIINENIAANLQQELRKFCKFRTSNNRNVLTKPPSPAEKPKGKEMLNEGVTVNAILRAVENKDFSFLSKYVTRENVNTADDYGWTPLISAAYCGHLDVTEFLLKLGANRKIREKSGLTAAQLALKRNHLSIVALLRKKSERTTEIDTTKSDTDINESSRLTSPPEDHIEDLTKRSVNEKECISKDIAFYCEICHTNFYHTTWKKHQSSTLHIFNTKPKLSNAIYGISKQNKGYQMLLNHGWDEQNGLGPLGNGRKYPIKTCLKADRKGLGQSNEKEYRVTHFKSGNITAITDPRASKPKCLKKKDREKLLNREARKERALRIALS